jgi:NADH-quinone oxidoreductase subunit G
LGAIEAGALPLPAFGVDTPGRDADAILTALMPPERDEDDDEPVEPELRAVVVGGVDPDDFADPSLAHAALGAAQFVVSLEIRRSAVTEYADVVLPVAPPVEKAGRYVNWEGRRRPFDLTIQGTGALTDGQVLDHLAEELDAELNLRTVAQARDELAEFVPYNVASFAARADGAAPDGVVLATWPELLDAGRMQDGDRYLADTAKPTRALVSAATAGAHGITTHATVSTDAGSITVPVQIADLPENVVWLPTNARGCAVRPALHAVHGSTVTLSGGES